ncbi:MAG: PKD domain-containing protein, partial [Candidatus Dormiibacterota bacterium]
AGRDSGERRERGIGSAVLRWRRLVAVPALAVLGCWIACAMGAAPTASAAGTTASTLMPAASDPPALTAAYAGARGLPTSAVGAIRTGSLRLASEAGGAQWAMAAFVPSSSATSGQRLGFQDGGSTGIFERTAGASWHLVGLGGEPFPCPGRLPAAVQSAWGLATPPGCNTVPSAPQAGHDAAQIVPTGAIGAAAARIALSQVGVSDTPVVHNFDGVDCDPYTTLVGPAIPNSDGCGFNDNFQVQNQNEFWCSDFAKWVWEQAGVTADVNTINAGSVSFYAWGKDQGERMPVDSTSPQVGDAAVFFPPGPISANGYADHVGIITKVNGDGTVNMVNGDFLAADNIHAEYDTNLHLATWASQVWNQGEQWVFVAPPTTTAHAAPGISMQGPSLAVASTTVGFTSHAAEQGGSITSYLWTFGDGGSATGANVTHAFRNAGRQTVTMTATSNFTTARTSTMNIDVVDQGGPTASTPNGPEYYTTQPVDQQLFHTSSSGALSQEYWDGTKWSDQTLAGSPASGTPPTALNYANANDQMTQHVFFRAASGQLTQSSLGASGWVTQTLPGMLRQGSPVAAALDEQSGTLLPDVFYVNASGSLAETSQGASGTWVTTTLPGDPAAATALTVTDQVVGGLLQQDLFYIDASGNLATTLWNGRAWQSGALLGSVKPSPATGLSAAAYGADGRDLYVFFTDATGRLAAAVYEGAQQAWTVRRLAGSTRAGGAIWSTEYLASASTGSLALEVFYLTPSGAVGNTALSGSTWTTSTLPGTATRLLGASAYPDGVQGQNVFFAGGSAVELDSFNPQTGTWTEVTLPGSTS